MIAGLIQRDHPGAEKTRRQVTVSSDLIYDVLRKHQPDHAVRGGIGPRLGIRDPALFEGAVHVPRRFKHHEPGMDCVAPGYDFAMVLATNVGGSGAEAALKALTAELYGHFGLARA